MGINERALPEEGPIQGRYREGRPLRHADLCRAAPPTTDASEASIKSAHGTGGAEPSPVCGTAGLPVEDGVDLGVALSFHSAVKV